MEFTRNLVRYQALLRQVTVVGLLELAGAIGHGQIQLLPGGENGLPGTDGSYRIHFRPRDMNLRMPPEEVAAENLKIAAALERIHSKAAAQRGATALRLDELQGKAGTLSQADVERMLMGKQEGGATARTSERLRQLRDVSTSDAGRLQARMGELTERALKSEHRTIGEKLSHEDVVLDNLKIRKTLARIRGVELPPEAEALPNGGAGFGSTLTRAIYLAEISAERELRLARQFPEPLVDTTGILVDKTGGILRHPDEVVVVSREVAAIKIGAELAEPRGMISPPTVGSLLDQVIISDDGQRVLLGGYTAKGALASPQNKRGPSSSGLSEPVGHLPAAPVISNGSMDARGSQSSRSMVVGQPKVQTDARRKNGGDASMASEVRVESRGRLKLLLEGYLADKVSFREFCEERARLASAGR